MPKITVNTGRTVALSKVRNSPEKPAKSEVNLLVTEGLAEEVQGGGIRLTPAGERALDENKVGA